MARKPGPGRCVHCLEDFQIRNWDHVLPRSWYPDSTPQNLEKWQIPSCKKCNSEYGRIEEDLLVMLAMTVRPDTGASSGIYGRAMRSVDESLGRDKRDRQARRARKNRILQSLMRGDEIPDEGIYPNLGERWGRGREEQIALTIPANHIRRFCEKIVRGIHYLDANDFVEPPFSIEFYALDEQGSETIRKILQQYGKRYVRGPGFEVVRVVPMDEPRASLSEITIFGEFKMYASVDRKEANKLFTQA